MADKDFVVKNGLVVNTNVLVVNGANVGINTTTPDAVFTVAGTANLQGNIAFTGHEINATANVTFIGNVHTKNNVFIDKKLYVGNTATMVQDLPTIIQAVDNFNGFVMVSSQNLSIEDDACADLLIYSDNTNGLTYFNDLGINNSRFDGRIHRIIANSVAASWALGEIVYQRNTAGANIAVGEIRDRTVINSTAVSLKIRVSEEDGLFAPLVDMADFVNTASTNLSLYAMSSGTNADILHAVSFFSTEIIPGLSRRNYAFTIGKRGDGYLYNANSALTIGTTRGGMREITETILTTYSSGANVIVMNSGNTKNIKADMDVTGSGIQTGTYITSIINSTAFRLSKPTIGSLSNSTITARDEFYDLSEANNPIIFHVGGMMGKNEIARFSGTGNFTIGPNTTNRNSKLTVNGTANLVGQVNVGANVNVVGNINATANVNAPRGIFTVAVNVGTTAMNSTSFLVGNATQNASAFTVSGNTTVSTATLRSGNLVIGNTSVTDSALVQVQNSTFSSNVTPGNFRAGISTVNTTVISVGANVFANATAVSVGNSSVNVIMEQNTTSAMRVTGNATISANLTTANLIVTNQITGQVNAVGNVNVTGVINATANVQAPRGVFSTAVNVGSLVTITSKVDVGSNVSLDTTGLRVTGNTLIPSMNIAGGNITSGNNSIANTPTVQLTNSTATSNLTPGGFESGTLVVNGAGAVINIGANVSINSTHFAIGNATANVVIAPSDPNWALSVKGDARVNGNLLVKGDATVNGALIFANTVSVNGDFTPAANDSFDLGNSSLQWGASYIKVINVPLTGNVTVGNSTINSVINFNAITVINSTSSANLSITGLRVGNSSVNGQYTSSDVRVGNSTQNSILNSTSLVIGNSSVNSTVNGSSVTVGNVFATVVNATTVNVSSNVVTSNLYVTFANVATANVLAVNASTINSTSSNATTANATTVNSTSVNATTVNTTNLFATTNVVVGAAGGNVFANSSAFVGNVISTLVRATTVNSTSSNVTTANATTVNSTTVNATTINAYTFQVGSAFKANSTDVVTANLTVQGNLVVTGSTTFVNTTILDVKDINITLAKDVPTAAAADGAGITVDLVGVSWIYNFSSNGWISNAPISVGNTSVNVSVNSSAFVGNTIGTHIGNVNAPNVNASSNVNVGANVSISNTGYLVSNTTAVANLTAGALRVGNNTITSAPQVLVQNTSGVSTINSNFISTNTFVGNVQAITISATSNVTSNTMWATNVSATFASIVTVNSSIVNATTINVSSNVVTTNLYSGFVNASSANIVTVNASSISGNLTGNVSATNMTVSNVINVGTDLLINNSRLWFVNSTSRSLLDGNSLNLGNTSVVDAPQIVVQNTAGISRINTTAISTTTFVGNVTAITVSASANVSTNTLFATNVYSTFANSTTVNATTVSATTLNITTVNATNLNGNVLAGTINSTSVNATTSNVTTSNAARFQVGSTFSANDSVVNSVSYNIGTTVVANATHLFNQLASSYYRSGGTDVALADGGTGSSLSAISGGVVYSNATGMAITGAGTVNWLLASGGAGGIPSWVNPSTLSVASAAAISGYSITSASTAGTIAARDGSGDINSRLFRAEYTDQASMSGALAFRVNNSTDNYIRFVNTPGPVRTWLQLGSFALQNMTYTTGAPSGGSAGDVHFQYIA